MKPSEFFEFAKNLDAQVNDTLDKANEEYASEEDKLLNLKAIAALLKTYRPHLKDVPVDILAEDVCWIFRLKHIVSQMKDVSIREDMLGRTIDDMAYGKLGAALRKERTEKGLEVPAKSNAAQMPYIGGDIRYKVCDNQSPHAAHNHGTHGLNYYCPGLERDMNRLSSLQISTLPLHQCSNIDYHHEHVWQWLQDERAICRGVDPRT